MSHFNLEHISIAAGIVRAVNHPLRQRILTLLLGDELPVTDIYLRLEMGQSECSQQLAILKNAKVLMERRDGKFKYYSVNLNNLARVNEYMRKLAEIDNNV